MAHVVLKENDSVERAIKVFRRQVQKAGILKEVRARRHYTKPSLAKRLKAQAARRRKLKADKVKAGR